LPGRCSPAIYTRWSGTSTSSVTRLDLVERRRAFERRSLPTSSARSRTSPKSAVPGGDQQSRQLAEARRSPARQLGERGADVVTWSDELTHLRSRSRLDRADICGFRDGSSRGTDDGGKHRASSCRHGSSMEHRIVADGAVRWIRQVRRARRPGRIMCAWRRTSPSASGRGGARPPTSCITHRS
jgi:hypothetical protein